MFALWIELLLLNLLMFIIGIGIAWSIWGRDQEAGE